LDVSRISHLFVLFLTCASAVPQHGGLLASPYCSDPTPQLASINCPKRETLRYYFTDTVKARALSFCCCVGQFLHLLPVCTLTLPVVNTMVSLAQAPARAAARINSLWGKHPDRYIPREAHRLCAHFCSVESHWFLDYVPQRSLAACVCTNTGSCVEIRQLPQTGHVRIVVLGNVAIRT